MIKLNLGCGPKCCAGMINIDIKKYSDQIDIVTDITNNLPFEEETVDIIYSSSVIEHFDREEWKRVLKYWYSLLKYGGEIQLSTVDMESISKRYLANRNIEELVGLLCGGSKEGFYQDRHGIVYDFQYLSQELVKIGFQNIEKCHWKDFEPYKLDSKFDDFSRSYLPHMDFESGTLMVLNIKARK